MANQKIDLSNIIGDEATHRQIRMGRWDAMIVLQAHASLDRKQKISLDTTVEILAPQAKRELNDSANVELSESFTLRRKIMLEEIGHYHTMEVQDVEEIIRSMSEKLQDMGMGY